MPSKIYGPEDLGHNLGLGHGGGDSIKHKPNYLSVMNYSFQMRGLIVNGEEGRFDYASSSVRTPTLDETELHGQSGLSGGGIPDGYGTRKFNCNQTIPAYVHILDANGLLTGTVMAIYENSVQANVNGDSNRNDFKNDEELEPWSDWAELVYNGGLIGLGASADELPITTPNNEMTPEDAAQIEPVLVVQQVSIDIKPDGTPNSISCKSPNGLIPVAILTTDTFDALTVDHNTVTFEGAAEAHRNKNGTLQRHENDVDRDGDIDLVLHFRFRSTELTCTSTQGTLNGETFAGLAIEGTDNVRIIR